MNTVASPERRRQSAGRPPTGVRPVDTGFRPDIEGLRAVAVLAVVLFHVGVPGIDGGFAGVDVFFVVSGFLITGLLWRDVASAGRVRLTRFYGARARRLLPAGCVVLVATAIGAAILLPPLQARQVLGDGIASALYVGNYSVRAARHRLPGRRHAPVAVPALLVPGRGRAVLPAVAGADHRGRLARSPQDPAHRLRHPTVGDAVPGASRGRRGSVVRGLARLDPHTAAVGVLLAARPGVGVGRGRAGGAVDSALAATAVGSGRRGRMAGPRPDRRRCLRLGETTPYPGTAALLPVVGTVLVIGAGCAAPRLGVGRGLSLPPMRAVGRMSYSWYLWHWPVLLLAPVVLGRSLVMTDRLAIILVSAGLALLTLHLIENPVRFATPLRHSTSRSLALGGAVTALAVCAALVLLVLRPVPVGHGAEAAALTVAAPPVSVAPAVDPHEAAVQEVTAQVQAAVAESAGLQAVPSNLSPPLADAPADKPAVFVNGCVRSWREVGQDECASGDVTSPTTVALVGDSHAAMWAPAFEQAAEQRHWRLETMGKVTCPLLDLPLTSPYLGREYTECEQWRGEVVARLQAERPRLIVVSMSRRYGADFGFTVFGREWLDSLTRLVTELRATGAAVLILGPIPDPQSTVPTCLSDHLDDATACSPPRPAAVNDAGVAAEAAATTAGGGRYADLTALFCTTERCPVIVGNDLVYRDDNHLTLEHAQALTPVVAALADRALAPG